MKLKINLKKKLETIMGFIVKPCLRKKKSIQNRRLQSLTLLGTVLHFSVIKKNRYVFKYF